MNLIFALSQEREMDVRGKRMNWIDLAVGFLFHRKMEDSFLVCITASEICFDVIEACLHFKNSMEVIYFVCSFVVMCMLFICENLKIKWRLSYPSSMIIFHYLMRSNPYNSKMIRNLSHFFHSLNSIRKFVMYNFIEKAARHHSTYFRFTSNRTFIKFYYAHFFSKTHKRQNIIQRYKIPFKLLLSCSINRFFWILSGQKKFYGNSMSIVNRITKFLAICDHFSSKQTNWIAFKP